MLEASNIVGDVIIYAGAITAAVVAILGAFKKFVIDPAAKKFTEAVREEMAPIDSKLNDIQKEVQINSGKSLKDLVIKGFNDSDNRMSKIEGEVEIMKDILTSHIGKD